MEEKPQSSVLSNLRSKARGLAASRLSTGQSILALAAIAYLFLYTVLFARWRSLPGIHDVWSVGDWLINFNGGFVRRGLGGWLLICLAHRMGIGPENLVAAAKYFFYGLIYLLSAVLIAKPRPAPFVLTLALLSPLALQFPAITSYEGGRKEIIALAWAAMLAWRASRGRGRPGNLGMAVFFLFLTSIHEGLFFFIPAFMSYVNFLFPEKRLTFKEAALLGLPSALWMAFIAFKGPSDPTQIREIILGFQGDPRVWNQGAIAYLGKGFRDGYQIAMWNAGLPRIALAAAAALLASLPTVLWLSRRSAARPDWDGPPPIAQVCLVLAFQIPIFAIGLDWSRWFMIDATLLALACLGDFRRRELQEGALSMRETPWFVFGALSLLYLATWRVQWMGELVRQSWENHSVDLCTLLMNTGFLR